MNRRRFFAFTGSCLSLTLGGCTASRDVDPDVERIERLGAAPGRSMTVSAEKDFRETSERSFEEWATRRATDHATERLRALLEDASLTGEGVSVGQGSVHLEDLDRSVHTSPPTESEFERAVTIGPRVHHYRHYSRRGDLLVEPGVAFEEIVETTPRSFEVTMDYPHETYVAVLPAMCQRGWIQND